MSLTDLKKHDKHIQPLIDEITKKCKEFGWEFCTVTGYGETITTTYYGNQNFISTGFHLHPNILVVSKNKASDEVKVEQIEENEKAIKKTMTWSWWEFKYAK